MIERVYDFREAKRRSSYNILVSSHAVYVKEGEDVFCRFVPYEDDPTVVEAYVDVRKDFRGKKAVSKCKEIIQWVFDNTDAVRIVGEIPLDNRKACFNAVLLGFKFLYLDEKDKVKIYEIRKSHG